MDLQQNHLEARDDESQVPGARSYRTNSLADRARAARVNGIASIHGWGPKLF
jgi:hypothetical protein